MMNRKEEEDEDEDDNESIEKRNEEDEDEDDDNNIQNRFYDSNIMVKKNQNNEKLINRQSYESYYHDL